jgi:hypothetical protein
MILCGFCRNINLGILLFNFSSKNYSSKVYTYLEKVVDLVILSTAKLGLLFLDCSTILNRFYKFQPKPSKRGESFYVLDPRTFKSLTDMPLAPPLDPTAMASSPAARWGTGRQTCDGELRLRTPVID